MIRKSFQRIVDLSSSDLIVATVYELGGADGATEEPPRPLMRPTLLVLRAIFSSLSGKLISAYICESALTRNSRIS